MCGICIVANREDAVDPGLIRRMCEAIVHRGPDSEGMHIDGAIGLGMRRLRVIDLESGDQPIYNDDRSICIVFNGEIYNYKELRKTLEGKGRRFRTESDTEVILRLYEELGAASIKQLNGMFAFAIHDRRQELVLIARDRMGIKPLFYTETRSGFAAASEIKSLLAIPDVSRMLDREAVDQYFSLLYVPSPRTMFASIKKLPPGCTLTIRPNSLPVIDRYWSLQSAPRAHGSRESLVSQFRDLFDSAVKRQLVSDVPLGIFLSGGIDSGALVASAARQGARIKTLSLGVSQEYSDFDERENARLVAMKYGTEHEEIVVEPDIHRTLERLSWTFDEPIGDHGAIPNFLICEAAKRSVTVALSGLGGDELSAGYHRHLGMQLSRLYARIPKFLRESIIRPLVLALPEPVGGNRSIDQAKRFVESASLSWLERYHAFLSPLTLAEQNDLFTDSFVDSIVGGTSLEVMREYACKQQQADSINKMLCLDMQMYMTDDLLAVADRTSMAASLEVRVPYLDNEIVEFMTGVRGDSKIRGLTKKAFLKNAFRDDLPKKIVKGKKAGFALPIARWLRDDLRERMEDSLTDARLASDGLFDPTFVSELKRQHYARERDRSTLLWALLMFHVWADTYCAR